VNDSESGVMNERFRLHRILMGKGLVNSWAVRNPITSEYNYSVSNHSTSNPYLDGIHVSTCFESNDAVIDHSVNNNSAICLAESNLSASKE
jgi:hypothetical protein